MVLVDTSVWIEVFRKSDPLDIEALADFDSIVTCLPVVQEVLQGFREEAQYRIARDAMLNMPLASAPVTLPLVESAVDLFRTARRRGITVRSSVDCLIAAIALEHDLEVMHRDRDYALLARVSRLRHRAV